MRASCGLTSAIMVQHDVFWMVDVSLAWMHQHPNRRHEAGEGYEAAQTSDEDNPDEWTSEMMFHDGSVSMRTAYRRDLLSRDGFPMVAPRGAFVVDHRRDILIAQLRVKRRHRGVVGRTAHGLTL